MNKKQLLPVLITMGLLSAGCAGTGGKIYDRRQPDAVLTDERIERNAAHDLKADDGISGACHIKISVYNGMTLLSGEAPNTHLRNKIITLVRVIPHVKSVHNEVLIARPSSLEARNNDALITDNLQMALADIRNIPGFSGTEIKVATTNGVTYLMGLVHKNEGAAAIEAAKHVIGVKKIVTLFEYID